MGGKLILSAEQSFISFQYYKTSRLGQISQSVGPLQVSTGQSMPPRRSHNDIQHNDTQQNGFICDTQHTHTQHNSIGCHYAECHDFFIVMLSVVTLNVILLSVMVPGAPLQGKPLALPTNIRLGWENLPGTNTLAYYKNP